jgi:hypothetical protein
MLVMVMMMVVFVTLVVGRGLMMVGIMGSMTVTTMSTLVLVGCRDVPNVRVIFTNRVLSWVLNKRRRRWFDCGIPINQRGRWWTFGLRVAVRRSWNIEGGLAYRRGMRGRCV